MLKVFRGSGELFRLLVPVAELLPVPLDQAYEPNKHSRLSCQISVTDDIDGLIVSLPEKQ